MSNLVKPVWNRREGWVIHVVPPKCQEVEVYYTVARSLDRPTVAQCEIYREMGDEELRALAIQFKEELKEWAQAETWRREVGCWMRGLEWMALGGMDELSQFGWVLLWVTRAMMISLNHMETQERDQEHLRRVVEKWGKGEVQPGEWRWTGR